MERDPLRAISQAGVFVLFYLVTISVSAGPLYWAGGQLIETTVTPLAGAVAATLLCWKIYGGTPLPHVGLTANAAGLRDFAIGIAAGAAAVTLALVPGLILHLAGFTRTAGGTPVGIATIAFVTVLLFCGAAGEEMLFHGYAFQSLMIGLGPFATIFPVGVIFGLLHQGNPDATWMSTANTAGFGIIFGYAVYRTSALWLSVGMHFGWNLALPFFGVKISGITMRITGYEMTWNAGPLWSGGAYGPEGSVLTSSVLVLLFVFVWRYPFVLPRPEEPERVENELSV